MINNNKKLVQKVSGATDTLESSAQEVRQASNVMKDYSVNIIQAIDEINDGITKQSEHAEECVRKQIRFPKRSRMSAVLQVRLKDWFLKLKI